MPRPLARDGGKERRELAGFSGEGGWAPKTAFDRVGAQRADDAGAAGGDAGDRGSEEAGKDEKLAHDTRLASLQYCWTEAWACSTI
eukprot:5086099-Pyramimonas_sp.AAC.1